MKIKSLLRILFFIIVIPLWVYVIYRFETVRIFTITVPPVIGILTSKNRCVRNVFITVFVVLWLGVFHYESTRYFYWGTALQKKLPKTKFLFPPLGWIMYYSVGNTAGYVEVYGLKNNIPQFIDPHDIFRVRTIGYDNIHRGILGTVSYGHNAGQFCRFLNYRFPYFDEFVVTTNYHPDLTGQPYRKLQEVRYRCPGSGNKK